MLIFCVCFQSCCLAAVNVIELLSCRDCFFFFFVLLLLSACFLCALRRMYGMFFSVCVCVCAHLSNKEKVCALMLSCSLATQLRGGVCWPVGRGQRSAAGFRPTRLPSQGRPLKKSPLLTAAVSQLWD